MRQSSVEVRSISDLPEGLSTSGARHARYADLVLFGPGYGRGYPLVGRHVIEITVFVSGPPPSTAVARTG
jgi:hypothetical protein